VLILFNALGIKDSGGIVTLNKSLEDCRENCDNFYIIICNKSEHIKILLNHYKDVKHFQFKIVRSNRLVYRLYFENFVFRKIVNEQGVELIYNFTGSSQRFLKVKKLIKIHNLLFYSKTLDSVYLESFQFLLWLRQVFFKRLLFKFMISREKYFEVQSLHVRQYINDFMEVSNKNFFIKSDINVSNDAFLKPNLYDFDQRVNFLYIVGPHFNYVHKNFRDFVDAMTFMLETEVDFEITITIAKSELKNLKEWDSRLDSRTNFLGYFSDPKKIKNLFRGNTILISTSIIETLGLHVIEAIQNGVVSVVPDEEYAHVVYGENVFKYKLFEKEALPRKLIEITKMKDIERQVVLAQNYIKKCEARKLHNLVDIFSEVRHV